MAHYWPAVYAANVWHPTSGASFAVTHQAFRQEHHPLIVEFAVE